MAAEHIPGFVAEVRNINKSYAQTCWFARRRAGVQALDDVSLAIPSASTFALVGESGSGKSTLAKCMALLEAPDSGEILSEGRNLLALNKRTLTCVRPQIQLIFQDAATAFNPRFSALEIVAEPLTIQNRGSKQERKERALELMEQVGIPAGAARKLPLEFSGGQRQRLALARALTLNPRLLILDEALSGLDLSIHGQMLNLLMELQSLHSLTYLYISHDLGTVGQIADQVAVMHQGKIVEQATPYELFRKPQHPQTQVLIAAMPWVEVGLSAGAGKSGIRD